MTTIHYRPYEVVLLTTASSANIQFGQGLGQFLQPLDLFLDLLTNLQRGRIQGPLTSLGRRGLGLPFPLALRRREALRIDQGLLSFVPIPRNLIQVDLGNFDKIAKNMVITNLQVIDTSYLPLLLLKVSDHCLPLFMASVLV